MSSTSPGPLTQPRQLVAPELRQVDFNPLTDSPFGNGLSALSSALEALLGGRKPMPILTAWGLLADRVYPWSFITSIEHRVSSLNVGRSSDERPDRTSEVVLLAGGQFHRLSGPYMAMLEGLPQLLPRYQWLASRPIALDLAGTKPLGRGTGGFTALLEVAKRAAEPLLENVSGYREHKARLSSPAKATLARALTEEPGSMDPGALAAVIAALHGATELSDEIGQCILSPNPLFAAIAKVAAGKLGLGPIVTGQLSEVAPFLNPADLLALEVWSGA